MAISIDWGTQVITVPQSYLTLISGTLYELDTNQFRLDLKALEASLAGMPNLRTHNHNTEVTIAGTTFARTLEIINGYSITFQDGQYTVRLSGSNNNFFDVENNILNQNQVQIIAQNSAGLIVSATGGGSSPWSTVEKDNIIADVNETKALSRKASDEAESANAKLN